MKLMIHCFELLGHYASSKLVVYLIWQMKADTVVIYTVVALATTAFFLGRNCLNCGVSMCNCGCVNVCVRLRMHSPLFLRACVLVTQCFYVTHL